MDYAIWLGIFLLFMIYMKLCNIEKNIKKSDVVIQRESAGLDKILQSHINSDIIIEFFDDEEPDEIIITEKVVLKEVNEGWITIEVITEKNTSKNLSVRISSIKNVSFE